MIVGVKNELRTIGLPEMKALVRWSILVGIVLCYAIPEVCRTWVNHTVGLIIASDVTPLRTYLLGFGLWAPLISAGLMVLQALVIPIPGIMLNIANGLLFGAIWGSLLTWGSTLLAASVCYTLSSLFKHSVTHQLVPKPWLEASRRMIDHHGVYAILIARLIPLVSADAMSFAAGLLGMPFRTFLLATAVGSVPGTLLFVLLGDHLPQFLHLISVLEGSLIPARVVELMKWG